VKVSHSEVLLIRLTTSAAVRNDRVLRRMFEYAARGLPLSAPLAMRRAANRAALLAHAAPEEQPLVARHERSAGRSESQAR